MAAGGIYDHLGGGFARYAVDGVWLVPHFEKMLYDNALADPPLPPRLAAHRRATATARCSPRRSTTCCATSANPAGGIVVGRGRRQRGRGGQVLRLDRRRRSARCSATDADVGPRLVRLPRRRQLRGRHHDPEPHARRGAPGPAARDRGGRGSALLDARDAAGPARARRQGAHRVERLPGGGAGRGRRRRRRAGVGGRGRRDGRVPAGQPPPRRRPLAAGLAGRGRRPPPRLRHRPRRAASTPSPAWPRPPGEARWITEARAAADALLDLFWDDERGGVFTTGHDAEALIARPKDLMDNATPGRQRPGRRRAAAPGGPHRRRPLPRAGRGDRPAARPAGRRSTRPPSATCSPPSTSWPAAPPRSWWPATGPTW